MGFFQDEVAKINSEIICGVTEEMRQLQVFLNILLSDRMYILYSQAFYLGVTNEWLEAMALAMGINKKVRFVTSHHFLVISYDHRYDHSHSASLYNLLF